MKHRPAVRLRGSHNQRETPPRAVPASCSHLWFTYTRDERGTFLLDFMYQAWATLTFHRWKAPPYIVKFCPLCGRWKR